MIAITTKFHGPTNTKGARITAKASNGHSITLDYHGIDASTDEAKYKHTAYALCKKMAWGGTLLGGGTADGFVFVFVPASVSSCVRRRINEIESKQPILSHEADELWVLKQDFA